MPYSTLIQTLSQRGAVSVLSLLTLFATPAFAQEIDFGGEIRPRFEVRDVPGTANNLEFTTMRTRFTLLVGLPRGMRGMVQLQDVRAWGEELSTVDPQADGLDMHQAWVELGVPGTTPFQLRLGRQELAYGGERLIGALNWAQQARAFDGGRLRYEADGWSVDGLALRLGDEDAGTVDAGLYGVYGMFDVAGSLDGYALYRAIADITDEYTLGTRWVGVAGPADVRVEAAYQTGTRFDQDVAAYLLGLRAGMMVTEQLRATLWYDRLSGDDDPLDGTLKVFDTLYATNHKFYGYMDLFLDIPTATANRGLQDAAVKTSYRINESMTAGLDAHAFMLSASDGLDSGYLGTELDLTGGWAFAPGVGWSGGVAYFMPGDAWTALGGAADNMFWLYLMLDVVF